MTDWYIRAMLRAATAQKLLTGWQGPHTDARSYCIAPKNADAAERDLGYVEDYVRTLETAGLKPLFRDSEPVPQ